MTDVKPDSIAVAMPETLLDIIGEDDVPGISTFEIVEFDAAPDELGANGAEAIGVEFGMLCEMLLRGIFILRMLVLEDVGRSKELRRRRDSEFVTAE